MNATQTIVDSLKYSSENQPFCLNCGAPEVNKETDLLFVRGYKVYDEDGTPWSHCMRCHVWFSERGELETCKLDCYCQEIYPGTPNHYETGKPINAS